MAVGRGVVVEEAVLVGSGVLVGVGDTGITDGEHAARKNIVKRNNRFIVQPCKMYNARIIRLPCSIKSHNHPIFRQGENDLSYSLCSSSTIFSISQYLDGQYHI